VGTRCADHVTPLYPQKLALTSPTGGGRSVGIVRVGTKATELVAYIVNIRSFLTEVTCNLSNLGIYTDTENTRAKVKEKPFKVVMYIILI